MNCCPGTVHHHRCQYNTGCSACAESTLRRGCRTCTHPVHLRSCREQSRARSSGVAPNGSPPLTRRAGDDTGGVASIARFTSARTENSPRCPPRSPHAAVHLRSRRKQYIVTISLSGPAGSPLLPQRVDLRRPRVDRRRWFISAREESSRPPQRCRTARTVHLRSRESRGTASRTPGWCAVHLRSRKEQWAGELGSTRALVHLRSRQDQGKRDPTSYF